MSVRDIEYYEMYNMYLRYEKEYWHWAEMRKAFNDDIRNRTYYRKNNAKNRRKFAEKVVADYPNLAISGWDLKNQIGGCKEIVFDFGLTKWINDIYEVNAPYGGTIYLLLRDNPDLIYRAIEETYDWSIEIGIRTTLLAVAIPKVIEFIAKECIV